MGNEYLRRKQYKAAAKAYTEALKSDPRNPTLFRNRAAAFAALGLWSDCVKDTETVVSLMPNNRKAMLRHKSVVDFLGNFNATKSPGCAMLLMHGRVRHAPLACSALGLMPCPFTGVPGPS